MKNYIQFINESLNKDTYENIASELEDFWSVMKNSFQQVEKFNTDKQPFTDVKKPKINAIYSYNKKDVRILDAEIRPNFAQVQPIGNTGSAGITTAPWDSLIWIKDIAPVKKVTTVKKSAVNTNTNTNPNPNPNSNPDVEKIKPIVLNPKIEGKKGRKKENVL